MTHIQLFITCLVDSFYPQTGEAIVDILHRLGIDVEFAPDQTCCGQPNFNAGLRAEARPIAEHMIRVFERTTDDIVVPSGSCAHMMKHGYIEQFADDPKWLPRAQSLASRVYEFTEYIVDRLGVTDLGAKWNGTLTYHASCHSLRDMGIDRQPRALLANVKDATIVELPDLVRIQRVPPRVEKPGEDEVVLQHAAAAAPAQARDRARFHRFHSRPRR